MITIKQDTTLIGVSELRKGIEKILEKAKNGMVIIEKRHKPAAVLMSGEEYEHIQRLLETAEDIILGFMAHERYSGSDETDYLDINALFKPDPA